MLAADCAWAVLRAEHAHIRELLTLVENAVESGGWAFGGPQAQQLSALIERVQAFDQTTHRPKGVVLVQALRGRSVQADDLLIRLESARDHGDELLTEARNRLKAAASGVPIAASGVDALLKEHRLLVLAHLDEEDSLLRTHTAEHLTREDWAAVASSISVAMVPAKV